MFLIVMGMLLLCWASGWNPWVIGGCLVVGTPLIYIKALLNLGQLKTAMEMEQLKLEQAKLILESTKLQTGHMSQQVEVVREEISAALSLGLSETMGTDFNDFGDDSPPN